MRAWETGRSFLLCRENSSCLFLTRIPIPNFTMWYNRQHPSHSQSRILLTHSMIPFLCSLRRSHTVSPSLSWRPSSTRTPIRCMSACRPSSSVRMEKIILILKNALCCCNMRINGSQNMDKECVVFFLFQLIFLNVLLTFDSLGEPPKIPVERYSAELAEFVAYWWAWLYEELLWSLVFSRVVSILHFFSSSFFSTFAVPPLSSISFAHFQFRLFTFLHSLSNSLQKIPENRPKYDHAPEAFPTQPSLIKHPYILHAGTIGINVAEWYHSILWACVYLLVWVGLHHVAQSQSTSAKHFTSCSPLLSLQSVQPTTLVFLGGVTYLLCVVVGGVRRSRLSQLAVVCVLHNGAMFLFFVWWHLIYFLIISSRFTVDLFLLF